MCRRLPVRLCTTLVDCVEIRIVPDPNLVETVFKSQNNTPIVKLMASTMLSAAIGNTVQCFLCCVITVCQSLIKFVDWQ